MIQRHEQPFLSDLQEQIDPLHLTGNAQSVAVRQRTQQRHSERLIQRREEQTKDQRQIETPIEAGEGGK